MNRSIPIIIMSLLTVKSSFGETPYTHLEKIVPTPVRYVNFTKTEQETGNSTNLGLSQLLQENGEVAHKWSLSTDYLNWQIRRRDLDYAIGANQTANAIGSGTIHELTFGQSSGYRTQLNYSLPDSWVVGFGYTHYANQASNSQMAANDGTLFATRSHPKINETAMTANASGELYQDTFVLELRRSLLKSDQAAFDIYGGFIWGENDQRFVINYDGFDFNQGVVQNTTTVKSFGLRFGAEGVWGISDSFYAFGSGDVSLMYGDYSVAMKETEFNAVSGLNETIVDVQDSYELTLPSLTASIGVGWKANDRADIRIGYEFAAWLGLADRAVFLDDIHEAVYSKDNHNVMFDGLFIRASFAF